MSCFIAPLAQAIATSASKKCLTAHSNSIWVSNLPTLEKMLWGGSLVLIVDHIAHGELFTFSLQELLTVGIPMSLVVTAVWALLVLKQAREAKA